MAKKDICLGLLNQYKTSYINFFANKKIEKKIINNDEEIDVLISVEEENKNNIEEVSKEITNLILSVMKDILLKEYIQEHYNDSQTEEKEKIYRYSLNLFNEKEDLVRNTVYTRVYTYIMNNDYINIDGFVKFRIKEFRKYISTISDIALEEYLIQKDQDEFINVLKYFIDMQEEKIDYIKVHIIEENYINLYDKNGKRVNGLNNEEMMSMAIQENLNYEDFLISTLLTLCPKKIDILDSINNNSSKEIIETIQSVFGDRVNISLPN